ncbi:hypothetical protein RchiOBHm_Chr4g0417221 [Rosa chinensis]|uniref:Uncharacterized protein n=1 Tax=Rosa chinensis TaxID=74649 RepID=A0A2P6QX45_ROSCH|nr:hypothetical protein RchiOBHm_Chr4g0417221 [Rosa chinensis]
MLHLQSLIGFLLLSPQVPNFSVSSNRSHEIGVKHGCWYCWSGEQIKFIISDNIF